MNPTCLFTLTANPTSPSGVLLGECSKCMELKIRTGNTIYLMTSCLVINSVGFALPRWLQAYVITPRNDNSSISSRQPTFSRGDRVTTWRPTQGQQHCNMTPSAMLPSLSPCSAVIHAECRTRNPFGAETSIHQDPDARSLADQDQATIIEWQSICDCSSSA